MTHNDHIALIRNGIAAPGGVWADFGSGDGAFTLALRDVAGDKVAIYSIDRNGERLTTQKQHFNSVFPGTNIHYLHEDFSGNLSLPELDGIMMANSLHYIEGKTPLLRKIKTYLKPGGAFILVEYNTDTGNPWVPYPISFDRFVRMADKAGFTPPRLIKTIPSRFLHEMYSAVTTRT